MVYYIDEKGEVRNYFSGKKVPKNEAEWVKFSLSLHRQLGGNEKEEIKKVITESIVRRIN